MALHKWMMGVVIACSQPMCAFAHGDIHQQIEKVSQQLTHTQSADLLVKRARLWQEHAEWKPALQDIKAALDLNPDHADTLYRGSQIALQAKQNDFAMALAERFFKHVNEQHNQAGLARAHRLLADNFLAVDERKQAIQHWQQSLSLQQNTTPDAWIGLADLQLREQGFDAASQTLQQGLTQLNQNESLQQRLVAMAVDAHAYPLALKVLDQQLNHAQSIHEIDLLLQKAKVLHLQGKHREAQHVRQQARQLFSQLPDGRKGMPAALRLQQQLTHD